MAEAKNKKNEFLITHFNSPNRRYNLLIIKKIENNIFS